MDGKSPLEINLGPLNIFKKPLIKAVKGTNYREIIKRSWSIKR